jgi:hypothetical protein
MKALTKAKEVANSILRWKNLHQRNSTVHILTRKTFCGKFCNRLQLWFAILILFAILYIQEIIKYGTPSMQTYLLQKFWNWFLQNFFYWGVTNPCLWLENRWLPGLSTDRKSLILSFHKPSGHYLRFSNSLVIQLKSWPLNKLYIIN